MINGRADVSAETRQRVEAAIREHGYERSHKSVRPAPLLEVIFHELESDWALEIIMGVEAVAREHDLAVVLSEMQGRRTPGRSWLEGVLARRPTGVIAVLSDLSEGQRALLKSRGVPLVVVDPTGEPLHDTPSIGATNWSGGLTATRHLLTLGHRRIGVISGPENVMCSRARLDGYRAAMDEAGVPIDPALDPLRELPRPGGDDRGPRAAPRCPIHRPRSSPATTSRRSASTRPPARRDCTSRRISASSASTTCPSRRGSVRRSPPFANRWSQMAMAAARLVLRLANGEQPSQTRVELATELIIRESTAPPRG